MESISCSSTRRESGQNGSNKDSAKDECKGMRCQGEGTPMNQVCQDAQPEKPAAVSSSLVPLSRRKVKKRKKEFVIDEAEQAMRHVK